MEWHDLLAHKDFEELTPTEKEQVLQWGSQEEYQAQRQAIVASQHLWDKEMAGLTPAPPSKALAALQKKQTTAQQEPVVVPWWQYSIPVWKVAAAALLLLSISLVWPKGTVSSSPTVLVQRDTVYIDQYITKIEKVVQPADTIIQVIYKTIQDTATTLVEPVLARASSWYEPKNEEAILAQEEQLNLWDAVSQSSGQSLHQDTFLQELTQEIATQVTFSRDTW